MQQFWDKQRPDVRRQDRPGLRLRVVHRDRGSPACRTNNPGIPVMRTTDTCGLDTRAVTQGGKEEYRPLLVTQQPRKYQRKRRERGARTPLSRPSARSSEVEVQPEKLTVAGSNPAERSIPP